MPRSGALSDANRASRSVSTVREPFGQHGLISRGAGATTGPSFTSGSLSTDARDIEQVVVVGDACAVTGPISDMVSRSSTVAMLRLTGRCDGQARRKSAGRTMNRRNPPGTHGRASCPTPTFTQVEYGRRRQGWLTMAVTCPARRRGVAVTCVAAAYSAESPSSSV